MKTTKIDATVTSTRPDLDVVARVPGAYVITKDGLTPDLNDHAMKTRNDKGIEKTEDTKAVEVKSEKTNEA